jgi:NAD(P)-dependent dehydrogenase (short-subunit alcohol dehydrogenase family)
MTTAQHPLNSRFDATSSTDDVIAGVDLRGRTAIVTGGYSGLGLETTRALASAGASVVVPARSAGKARAALSGLEGVELAALDLLDPASIAAFARTIVDSGRAVHMLVNSAGVMATPLRRDARGHEQQFSANHLGHFALAVQLWPALVRAGAARLVSVSSRGHRFAGIDFDDPDFERRPYDKWQAYGQSKTANVLLAVEADRRGREQGIRAFAVHPGSIMTDLARDLDDDDFARLGIARSAAHGHVPAGLSVAEGGDFRTIAQGAATAVWCATSPELDGLGGVYCENVNVAGMAAVDNGSRRGVSPWAVDPELARRLWAMSERMSGVSL